MRIKAMILAAALAVTALGVTACGGDDDSESAATESAATTSESGTDATVSFTEPSDGATTGDSVTAEVELEGFEIDAKEVGMAPEEGHGHLHFSMDEGKFDHPKYSGANGELAKQLGVDGQYSPATEPTITYENLPSGEHTLEVYLAENNHSDTGISATTTFTVE